ncbi:MAG: hypothetical protein RML47_08315 [Bacteroidota bacterium]|nr:hypothetical protein [Rhodothermia bacterium]MCS7155073.1 hypothetical protein [Bacteroidota bacterium]MDW8138750.1 hypothetical protein [Bacteroidota bacterium]MDW8286085.1 hypothetical protein [Bacteroidota bacterium]
MGSETWRVFENERVQYRIRQRVHLLLWGLSAATGMAIVLGLGSWLVIDGLLVLVLLFGGSWLAVLALVSALLVRMQRVVWCVQISPEAVVGYDYARRKTRIEWLYAERVDFDRGGIRIRNSRGRDIEIPADFDRFPEIGELVFQYAEAYEVPLYIEGRSWRDLDIAEIYDYEGFSER